MAAILFEVEQAAWIAFHLPVVVARMLEPQPFVLGATATLDGHGISQFQEIPASFRADGTPRPELYAFALLDAEQLAHFKPGAIVRLLTTSENP